ncbi:MAG: lipopolysaccharide biosynthesis protein [Alistipes sp.]
MEKRSIKAQLVSGVFYTAIAKYAGIVISIIITGVLSRLLTPEDFGTIVPIMVLVTFFTILGDMGVGPAVLQNKTLTPKDINSIFSIMVLMGMVISIVFFLSSWSIADMYDNDIFVNLCQLLTISLFFSCANIVPNALLYKAKMFRFLAMRSLFVQFVAGAVAILSAYFGAGLYALVIQSLMASVLLFAVSYRANPLKLSLWKIDFAPMRKILDFSSYQFLFNILNYFSVNLDKLLLNKYMGSTQLGYYDKSYKLMQMPLQNIPYVITPVMHPIFADMQTDVAQMHVMYAKVVRFLAFIGFPLSVFLYFAGQELIFILFGMQWGASIPVFKILALSVGFQIVLSTSGSIFQASNSTKLLLLCGILSTLTIVTAIFVGLLMFNTIEALAICLSCAFATNFIVCFFIMYHFVFKVHFLRFLKQLISPLVLAALSAMVLYVVTLVMAESGLILSILTKGCVAGVLFVFYIQYTNEYNLLSKARQYLAKFRGQL